jgi:hypothetical protein
MNLIRSLISVFILVLFGLAIAGWNWAGSLPSPKLEGARAVLGICGVAAIGSLVLLWRVKQPQLE